MTTEYRIQHEPGPRLQAVYAWQIQANDPRHAPAAGPGDDGFVTIGLFPSQEWADRCLAALTRKAA